MPLLNLTTKSRPSFRKIVTLSCCAEYVRMSEPSCRVLEDAMPHIDGSKSLSMDGWMSYWSKMKSSAASRRRTSVLIE